MGWVNGVFGRVHDWTEDEAGGYDILSTRMDEEDDNFETGINACLHKGGQNTPTDNLPMGGKRHTGVGDAVALTDYASLMQVQNSTPCWPVGGVTGGSLNAYTVTLNPAPNGYAAGQLFSFKANRTNSGATTLNVNGLGAKSIYSNGAPLTSGVIVINRVYSVVYDGTQFHLIGGASSGGSTFGGAKICMSSSQEIAVNTQTTVLFRTELYDDSSYYTVGSDALVIPVTGRYRVSCYIRWGTESGDLGESLAQASLAVNGTRWYAEAPTTVVTASFTASPYYVCPNLGFSWEGQLTQNDLVTIKVTHFNTAGTSRAVYGNSTEAHSSWLAIERIL